MAHIHEKIDFTVSAFIVSGDRVLLRKHDKYNIWLGVGGHVELHEDPIEALYREVKEEAGVEIELLQGQVAVFGDKTKDLPVPHFLHRHDIDENHEHVDMIYVVRAKSEKLNPSADETQVEFRWMTVGELGGLESDILENTKYYAERAIEIANRQS